MKPSERISEISFKLLTGGGTFNPYDPCAIVEYLDECAADGSDSPAPTEDECSKAIAKIRKAFPPQFTENQDLRPSELARLCCTVIAHYHVIRSRFITTELDIAVTSVADDLDDDIDETLRTVTDELDNYKHGWTPELGAEAEELRSRVEDAVAGCPEDDELAQKILKILDDVDARDSLHALEATHFIDLQLLKITEAFPAAKELIDTILPAIQKVLCGPSSV